MGVLGMVVSTSLAQLIDDFIVGITLSLGVVVGLGGRVSVVVKCERSANRDITMTSFASPGTFATRLTPSFLALSSSSPSSPFPSLFVLSLVALQAWLMVDSRGVVMAVQTMAGSHLGISSRVEGGALSHLMRK